MCLLSTLVTQDGHASTLTTPTISKKIFQIRYFKSDIAHYIEQYPRQRARNLILFDQ